MKRLSVSLMQQCYITWLRRGEYVKTGKLSIYRANKIAAIMSILINWAKKNGISIENPMPLLEKTPNPQRTVMWEPEQVNKFLTTAYSEWKWRSIGLIVQMAYEWGQRVGDMRMLTWAAINFDKKRCDLVQSKRGAEVHLPISDTLMHVLKQQHETFGFQCLVTPQVQPSDGSYKPYTLNMLHVYVNAVLEAAELPSYLTAMDMRRTAITEMVEAGVDITQIKQVSGHTNINSLTPYIKHTYTGASEALAQRQAFKEKK
jgi:integrase